MSKRRSWLVCVCTSMMGLCFGLGDGGRGIDACVEGVTADGNGGIECLRVEVLEVDGIVRPGHWIRHSCFRSPGNPDARLRCVARSGDSDFLRPLSATRFAINEIVLY